MKKEQDFKKKPQSLLTKSMMVLMIAFIISVLWNTVEWARIGYASMAVTLDKQIQRFANDVIERQPWLLEEFLVLEGKGEEGAHQLALPIIDQTEKVSEQYDRTFTKLKSDLGQVRLFFNEGWNVIKLSFLLVCIKFISFFSSTLLFVFSGLLGALDGLRKRYIRTMEAGRESTYMYHNISLIFRQLSLLLLLAYLLLPVMIPATAVVIAISSGLFVYCHLLCSTLKKFL